MEEPTSNDAQTQETIDAVMRFHNAFNSHAVEAVMSVMTEDCVFENTYPPPDGTRYEGLKAFKGAVEEFYAYSPNAAFEIEEMFACGDRACVRWVYRWVDADGKAGHVRGADVMRVRDGKISETLGYVKG